MPRDRSAQFDLFSSGKTTAAGPQLLVEWQAFWPHLIGNIRDLFRPDEPLAVTSAPGHFWPDVFVSRPVAWKDFGRSAFIHASAIFFVFMTGKYWMFPAKVTVRDAYDQTTISYYKVDDFLPQVKSPPAIRPRAKIVQKAQPELAKQEIISVPALADNSEQTIVNPPHPDILHETQPLPNMVADTPSPAPPTAALSQPHITLPQFLVKPVQPAPNVRRTAQANIPKVPVPEAVQPTVSAEDLKVKSEIKGLVAQMTPEVDAPKLAMPETGLTGGHSLPQPQAVPPPPSTEGVNGANKAAGQMMVLNLRPSPPPAEIKVPNGSRSGVFEASPTGKVGAPGTPSIQGDSAVRSDAGTNGRTVTGDTSGVPVGISVSGIPLNSHGAVVVAAPGVQPPKLPPASQPPDNNRAPTMTASTDFARRTFPPIVSNPERRPEDTVFAGKKYYSMQLNMPNLNSSGGSWIIRFAELKQPTQEGELSTPVVTEKIDPAYPADLMRDQVEGVVILYAVIHADGTVGDVRVLQSLHESLDANAIKALGRWHFRPATKNGVPVELEAVVRIPFKARKVGF